MKLNVIAPDFAVSGQVAPGDIPDLARQGFTTIICNRPDGEERGQPDAETVRAAAEAAGLAFHHIPVSGGIFPDAAVEAFGAARRLARGKLLAYCRTGTRAATLDALANVEGLPAQALIERACGAGYDLSPLRDRL